MSSSPTPNPQMGGAPPGQSNSGCKIVLWIFGILAVIGFFIVLAVVGAGWYGLHKMKQAGLDSNLMQKNPVYAAAKFAATTNPNIEIISSDDASGTLKVRDKTSGKVSTMKFDPESKSMIVTDENGKTTSMKFDPDKKTMVITDDKGNQALKITGDGSSGTMVMNGSDGNTVKIGANADSAPSWVPTYPGVTPTNGMSANGKDGQTGTYTFTTQDAPDKVMSYYSDALKSAGLSKTSTTSSNTDGKVGGFVSGSQPDGKKTVVVTVSTDNKGTEVGLTYSSKP